MEEVRYIQRATDDMLLELAISAAGIGVCYFAGWEGFTSAFTMIFTYNCTKLVIHSLRGWLLARKLLNELERQPLPKEDYTGIRSGKPF